MALLQVEQRSCGASAHVDVRTVECLEQRWDRAWPTDAVWLMWLHVQLHTSVGQKKMRKNTVMEHSVARREVVKGQRLAERGGGQLCRQVGPLQQRQRLPHRSGRVNFDGRWLPHRWPAGALMAMGVAAHVGGLGFTIWIPW